MSTHQRNVRSARQVMAMTRAELLALPASVKLEVAFRAIGVGRTKGYELLHSGELPFEVLELGSGYRVPTAPLLRLLGIDDPRQHAEAG